MKSRVLWVALVLLIAGLMSSCGRTAKADMIVIVNESGGASIRGKVAMERNPNTGGMEPQLWKEGGLFLFRAAQKMDDGFEAKAGTIYRVEKERKLKEVGTFDIKATDDALAKAHLTE